MFKIISTFFLGTALMGCAGVKDDSNTDNQVQKIQYIDGFGYKILDDIELGQWGNVLTDSEIMQPFDQIGRQCFAFTEEEKTSNNITRFSEYSYHAKSLMTLLNRDWRYEVDNNEIIIGNAYIIAFNKKMAGINAKITLTTGFDRDDLKGSDLQTIASVSFGESQLTSLQKIYPIQVSELRDISLIPSDLN